MSQFPNMLRYLRIREGLSQQQLADKLTLMDSQKMTRSRINNYENGIREPDLETMELFADFFNVDMNTIFGRDYSNKKPVTIIDDGMNGKVFKLMRVFSQLSDADIDDLLKKAQDHLQSQATLDDQ